jgi:MFS family permease
MCVYVCVCLFVCLFVWLVGCLVVGCCTHVYIHTYIHTHTHTRTQTHIHTYTHTHIHTYTHTHTHTYTHAYVAVFDVHVCVMYTRFVVGIASSLSAIADIPYLLEVAPVPQRGRVSSSYEMLVVIGVMTSFAANVILTDTCPSHGWR